MLERYCCKVDDLCFTFIKWTGQDEKKDVLDCYVPGARCENLNLVNSSKLRASILLVGLGCLHLRLSFIEIQAKV